MAVLLNILVVPVIGKLRKKGVPKPLAIGITLFLSAILIVFSLAVVASSLSQLINNVDVYEKRFIELYWDVVYSIPEGLGERINKSDIFSLVITSLKNLVAYLTSSIISLLSQSFVVGLFMIFFLLSDLSEKKVQPLRAKIENQIRDYMIVKVGLSLLTAVLTGSLLTVAQVDLALVFALLTFILNFIPNIGSLIAVSLPIPVLLLAPNLSLKQGIVVLGILSLIQFGIGNILEPKLIGEKLKLNPILVLFSLLLWGAVWGMIGAVLAIPLTAALKLLIENQTVIREANLYDQPGSRTTQIALEPPFVLEEEEEEEEEDA